MSRSVFLASFLGLAILLQGDGNRASAQSADNPPPAPAAPPTSPLPTNPAPGRVEDVKTPAPAAEQPPSTFNFTWGGQYRVLPNTSNFPFQPVVITPDDHTQTFVNQRMRLWATVSPSDHVDGYIQMQVGGFLWGDNVDFPKTFVGPRFPGADDRVGIMLRRGWLAYHDDDWGKVRVGILDWHDKFGDTLASSDYDFDIGGVDWTKTYDDLNNLKVTAAFLLLSDLALITTDPSPLGNHTAMLGALDVDQPVGDQSAVGGSAYFLTDRGDYSYPTFAPYKSAYDIWLGLRAKTVLMDALPVNGFVLLNTGQRDDGSGTIVFKHTGWAGKAEAGPLPVGCGKVSAQLLYASGSDHPGFGQSSEFRTVAQTYRDNFGAQGYWSYLYLTSPNGPSDVQDLGVSLQNRGLGLITIQGKYDYPLTCKLTSTSAVGWLRSDRPNPTSGASNMGTEFAEQFTYDFGGGLKLDTGAAFLLTGDFYKPGPAAPSPHDLYELSARLQLEF